MNKKEVNDYEDSERFDGHSIGLFVIGVLCGAIISLSIIYILMKTGVL